MSNGPIGSISNAGGSIKPLVSCWGLFPIYMFMLPFLEIGLGIPVISRFLNAQRIGSVRALRMKRIRDFLPHCHARNKRTGRTTRTLFCTRNAAPEASPALTTEIDAHGEGREGPLDQISDIHRGRNSESHTS